MQALLRPITTAVAARPGITIILVVLLTALLASFAPQQELSNDSSAFSPTNDEVLAAEELAERFDDAGTTTLQVVVTGEDVISADGAATQLTIERVAQDVFGDALLTPEGAPGAAIGYLTPAIAAAAQQVIDLAAGDDAQVDQLQELALSGPPPGQAPPPGTAPQGQQGQGQAADGQTPGPGEEAQAPDQAAPDQAAPDQAAPQGQAPPGGGAPGQGGGGLGFAAQLSAGEDPTQAPSGLVLLTLDDTAFADEAALATAQGEFADTLEAEAPPLDALPFSFLLVADPGEDFQAEVGRLFGIAALVILIVLAFVLRASRGQNLGLLGAVRRSLADMALALVSVMIGITWLQGIAVLLGPNYLGLIGQATPPTQIVPILLLALGVSYTIYVQSRYREELNRSASPTPREAVAKLGPTIGVALLLSMVTTAIGFLTNLVSPIPAIQDLGVLAAAGIVVIFLLTLTVLPAGRLLLDRIRERRDAPTVPRHEVATSERSPFARAALFALTPALKAPYVVLGVVLVLSAGGAWSLTQLDVEFDVTAFLPQDSPLVEAVGVLERDFGGGLAETTQVLVEGDAVNDEAFVQVVDQLRTDLVDVEGVVDVGGSSDLAAEIDPEAGAYDAPAARLSVRTQSEEVGAATLQASMDEALQPIQDLGLATTVTSDEIITDGVIDGLSSSQITGLLTTLGAVLLLIGVYAVRNRQPLLGVIITLPVGVVVLWVFGLMYLTGIPFDPITAIISALVIGVGIDFSIHLGERFVTDLEEAGGDVPTALRDSLTHTGAALAGSAFTTVLGFTSLIFASIVPFQRMGIVTVYAVGLALLSALSVLPPLLVLYGRRRGGHLHAVEGDAHDRHPDDSTAVLAE